MTIGYIEDRIKELEEKVSYLYRADGETSTALKNIWKEIVKLRNEQNGIVYADQPVTEEFVKVVRCKECIHYDLRWGKCNHADLQESMRFRPHRDKDDFCKRGERKTE